MGHDPVTDLQTVLALEKQALLTGDYDALETLAREKERLIAALEANPPSRPALRALRKELDANQAIMAATLRGIQAAQTRITALRQVQAGLTTYDKDGRLAISRAQSSTVEKKA